MAHQYISGVRRHTPSPIAGGAPRTPAPACGAAFAPASDAAIVESLLASLTPEPVGAPAGGFEASGYIIATGCLQ